MPSDPTVSAELVDTNGFQDLSSPVILVSGLIGIYYINAEKLARDGGKFNEYGNDSRAMISHACQMAQQNPNFGKVIDVIATRVYDTFSGVPYPRAVSGGQRRDWLFSGPVAERFGLPHISCYKDGHLYRISNEMRTTIDDIRGFNVVHVADLLTKGSSCYDGRTDPPSGWVPMIRGAGAEVLHVFAVVDRLQGGRENLAAAGVPASSFVDIDRDFLIRYSKQPDIAVDYIRDPQAWGENYIVHEGIEPFVPAFGPKRKDDRHVKFLAVYQDVLRQSSRWSELAGRVQHDYDVDIETLPYRGVKIGDE